MCKLTGRQKELIATAYSARLYPKHETGYTEHLVLKWTDRGSRDALESAGMIEETVDAQFDPYWRLTGLGEIQAQAIEQARRAESEAVATYKLERSNGGPWSDDMVRLTKKQAHDYLYMRSDNHFGLSYRVVNSRTGRVLAAFAPVQGKGNARQHRSDPKDGATGRNGREPDQRDGSGHHCDARLRSG